MNCNCRDLRETWHILMRDKRIYAKTVYERIPKELISEEAMKRTETSEAITRNGYYDWSREISDVRRNCLDYLVSLGYVTKKEDKLYQISYSDVVHPYRPFVIPFRGVVISNVTNNHIEKMILNSDEFSNFIVSSILFKDQMAAGNHLHVSSFDYSYFSYTTDVYEVEDKYFDAIFLNCDPSTDRLTVDLVEPFVQSVFYSKKNKVKKNWRTVRRIEPSVFLEGAGSIDAEVGSLPWKASYTGIITHKDKAYYLNPSEALRERDREQLGFLEMPDFLNSKLYSRGNMLSRIFEEAVKNYLTENYHYIAITRHKPTYLEKGDLDVFAEKEEDSSKKYITVCECKFRLPERNYPVSIDDVDIFRGRKEIIEENERKNHPNITFEFWLVTNGDKFDNGIFDQAKSAGIKIKKATLSRDWEKRADWKVTKMEEIT